MAQQINRTLQDKINKLNDAELNELGSSLVGKKVFILDDKYFYVDTVINYTISPFDWSPSNGNKKGDKNIVFELKRNFLNLLEVATEGDSLRVNTGGSVFLVNTIELLNEEKIRFSGGLTLYFPIDDGLKYNVEPTLLDIGWLSRNALPQMSTQQQVQSSNNKYDINTYDLILFYDGIYSIGAVFNKGTNDERFEYHFIGANGKYETSENDTKYFDSSWNMSHSLHKLQEGDVFVSNKEGKIIVKKISSQTTSTYGRSITFSQEVNGQIDEHELYEEDFVKDLVLQDFIYEGNAITNTSSTPLTLTIPQDDDTQVIDRELELYDIISFEDKMYYVSGFDGKGSIDNYRIKYKFETMGVIEESSFNIDDIDTTWMETPNFYEMSEGDVFLAINTKITINKLNTNSKYPLAPKIVDFTRESLLSGMSFEETDKITNLLDYFLLNKFNIAPNLSTQNVATPNVDVDITPLNMEGDFIGEFVNKNATNLLELEKNNRPLFDVVEMTLNLLSSKFGKGESVAEKVDVVIDNADEIIKNVQGKDPNLIGLTKIVVVANDGNINLKGNVYQSWTEFNDALKTIYDDNKFVGKKVKFQAWFDDGKHIIERVDIGVNYFDPYAMKVGEFIDRPFGFFDNLDEDLDKYQWDDEIVVTENVEGEPTREDIENEINALNVALMYEDDDERISEINERINALNITLTLI